MVLRSFVASKLTGVLAWCILAGVYTHAADDSKSSQNREALFSGMLTSLYFGDPPAFSLGDLSNQLTLAGMFNHRLLEYYDTAWQQYRKEYAYDVYQRASLASSFEFPDREHILKEGIEFLNRQLVEQMQILHDLGTVPTHESILADFERSLNQIDRVKEFKSDNRYSHLIAKQEALKRLGLSSEDQVREMSLDRDYARLIERIKPPALPRATYRPLTPKELQDWADAENKHLSLKLNENFRKLILYLAENVPDLQFELGDRDNPSKHLKLPSKDPKTLEKLSQMNFVGSSYSDFGHLSSSESKYIFFSLTRESPDRIIKLKGLYKELLADMRSDYAEALIRVQEFVHTRKTIEHLQEKISNARWQPDNKFDLSILRKGIGEIKEEVVTSRAYRWAHMVQYHTHEGIKYWGLKKDPQYWNKREQRLDARKKKVPTAKFDRYYWEEHSSYHAKPGYLRDLRKLLAVSRPEPGPREDLYSKSKNRLSSGDASGEALFGKGISTQLGSEKSDTNLPSDRSVPPHSGGEEDSSSRLSPLKRAPMSNSPERGGTGPALGDSPDFQINRRLSYDFVLAEADRMEEGQEVKIKPLGKKSTIQTRVKSARPLLVETDTLIVPTPLGQQLDQIEVRNEKGHVLAPDLDFRVIRSADGSAYALHFDENGRPERVSLEARFTPLPDTEYGVVPDHLFALDLRKIEKAVADLSGAGFSDLASRLKNLAMKRKVSASDVRREFAASARYSYVEEKAASADEVAADNPYRKYAVFGAEGRLCGQCDSANSMFADLMNNLAGDESHVRFKTVVVLGSRTRFPLGTQHLFTRDILHLVTQLEIDGKASAIFDATPWRSDSRNPSRTLKNLAQAVSRVIKSLIRNRNRPKKSLPSLPAVIPSKKDESESAANDSKATEEVKANAKGNSEKVLGSRGSESPMIGPKEPVESPQVRRFTESARKVQAEVLQAFASHRQLLRGRAGKGDPFHRAFGLLHEVTAYFDGRSSIEEARTTLGDLFPSSEIGKAENASQLVQAARAEAQSLSKEIKSISERPAKELSKAFPHLSTTENQRKVLGAIAQIDELSWLPSQQEIDSHRLFRQRALGLPAVGCPLLVNVLQSQ